jgi:hypothetical protein
MPIFRSQVQAELLTRLLLRPEREYTLTELGTALGVPSATIYRETARLIAAEIINVRPVGRAKLVRANTAYRLVRPLTELLVGSFGPHVVVAEEFGDITGVRIVLIYGSWATRYFGEYGPPPRDVDILIVGDPDRSDIYDAADRAHQRLGLPINPTLSSPRRWADSSDSLIRTIRQSPLLTVLDKQPAGS